MPMLRRPDLSPKWGRCNAVETVWQRLGNHHLSTASNVIDSIGLPSHHLNTLMGLTCCQPISHIAMLLRSSDVGVFAYPLNASGIVLAAPSQHHVSPASLAASWPIADQSSLSPPWASKVRKRSRRMLASGSGTRRSSAAASEGNQGIVLGQIAFSITE